MRRTARLKLLLWLPVPPLLYLALKDLQFRRVWEVLSAVTAAQLLLLLAVNLLFLLILAVRWQIILDGLGARLPLGRLLLYRLAGYAVSYLTPGPQFGGEPLQLYLAKNRSGLDYDVGSASLLLDKSFELLGNFAFLGLALVSLASLGLLPTGFRSRPLPLLALPALLIIAPATYLTAVFLGLRPLTRALALLPAGLRSRARFRSFAVLVDAGEQRIVAYCRRRGRTVAQIVIFFLLVWGTSLLEMRLILGFLGLAVGFAETLLILAGARFAFLLPFPGALGALELTYVALFELLGYGEEAALGLVLYMRARDLLAAAAGLGGTLSGGKRQPEKS